MAIDTENKRRFLAKTLPAPDGEIDDRDRKHLAWFYSVIVDMVSTATFSLIITQSVGRSLSITQTVSKSQAIGQVFSFTLELT